MVRLKLGKVEKLLEKISILFEYMTIKDLPFLLH